MVRNRGGFRPRPAPPPPAEPSPTWPQPGRPAQPVDELPPHLRELLRLVVAGWETSEIAARQFIKPREVKGRVNYLCELTGARNRAQLVVWAYETGFVRPNYSPAPSSPGE